MATFVPGGRQGMRNNIYGVMAQDTVNYIQDRIHSLTDRFGEMASNFQSKLQDRFNIGALRSISMARNNLNYTGSFLNEGIRRLDETEDFRLASPMAQLYLRAEPNLRKEIYAGRLEGWGTEDPYPDLHGERNPIYQSVMSGVVQYQDEVEGLSDDVFKVYYTEEDVTELKHNEVLIIRNNWNRLRDLINQEGEDVIDPTSISGNYL